MRGLLGLFRGKPLQPVDADGRMALSDHFRELRARLMRVLAALVLLLVVGIVFYDQLLELVMGPYNHARQVLGEKVQSTPTINGAAGPMLTYLKIGGAFALIGGAPIWLYQIWAFIMPGLHRSERKWTMIFVAIAGPLFLVGVGVGYYVLPKGLEVLIGFTPGGFQNLVEFNEYFGFLIRMLLIFGLGFEIPLFAVMLNLAGILPGRTMGQYRPWIILGTFVFAAVATPSTDPFSMSMLAIPLVLLFLVSEAVMRLLDRARARKAAAAALDVDRASALPS